MKKTFREYHALTDKEVDKIWNEAIVILDTNVLLDFYCFGNDTLDDYLSVLREVKKKRQLWMPYQVGYEFFENRVGIISKQLNQYDNLLKYLDGTKENISNLANISPNHAHLDFADIAQKYERAVKPIKSNVEKLKKAHPDHLGDDRVLAELQKVFTDSVVGAPYDDTKLEALTKEGEERYAKKIPPGYRDQDKKEDENNPSRNRKYGDLIIWKQMLDRAEEVNKSIIFVTNDAKDDWVLYAKDRRKLGAKPLLKKEMLARANVDFELYSSDEFLSIAHKQFNLPVKDQSVSEVKKYRELEMERANSSRLHYTLRHSTVSAFTKRRMILDELHSYIHRARELSREALRFAEGEQLPHEARQGLGYICDAYEDLHKLVDRGHEPFGDDLFRIEKVLMRCRHILHDLVVFGIPSLDELYHVTRKMTALVDNDRDL